MTRDDAIRKAANSKMLGSGTPGCSSSTIKATNFVAMAEALGMLKLEEPKSLETKIFEALDSRNWSRLALLHELDKHGLKIVEK